MSPVDRRRRRPHPPTPAPVRKVVEELPALTEASASNFAQLTLKCVQKKYPNQPGLILNAPEDVLPPEKAHPAFYGCYDWHSSVHGHWMLARLLRLFPSLPEAAQITKALNENLSAKNIAIEAAYFKRPTRKAFERTYGWAWTLKLAEELHISSSAEAKAWAANLKPLADTLAARYLDFLPKQVYPIRTGLHPNTAFGLSFALDYANTVGDAKLKELLDRPKQRLLRRRYRLSCEARAGRIGLPVTGAGGSRPDAPRVAGGSVRRPGSMPSCRRSPRASRRICSQIAIVTDRSDPQLGHLDGLNLSRAWCMRHIAAALPAGDPTRAVLEEAGHTHAVDALKNVATGHYEGEHWLGSFAVYLLTEPK